MTTNKEQLLQTVYELESAFNSIVRYGKISTIVEVLKEFGYTEERVEKILNFVKDKLSQEEIDTGIERKAHETYMDSITKLEKIMLMATGYQEMGDINLEISKDSFQAEEEGERLVNEMVTEKGKNTAEAN